MCSGFAEGQNQASAVRDFHTRGRPHHVATRHIWCTGKTHLVVFAQGRKRSRKRSRHTLVTCLVGSSAKVNDVSILAVRSLLVATHSCMANARTSRCFILARPRHMTMLSAAVASQRKTRRVTELLHPERVSTEPMRVCAARSHCIQPNLSTASCLHLSEFVPSAKPFHG